MTYTKKETTRARQRVSTGDALATPTLDGSNTTSILTFGSVAEKVSFQVSGTLAGTIEFSIDGVTFTNSTALPIPSAPGTFSSYLCKVVKITRSSGTGKVAVLAR